MRFLVDAMLGSLARWLRILGYDAAYDPSWDDPRLAELAVAEDRLLLTRDRRLVERRAVRDRSLLIADGPVEAQVRQVVAACGLDAADREPLGRCLRCNAPLEDLTAERARTRVPPYVARTQERFRRCPACERIYWRATHTRRMLARLRAMGLAGGDL